MAAGAAKDLASVQRGGEFKRLFTMFYSQLSLSFNSLQQTGQQYALNKDLGKLISSLTLLWFLQSTLSDLVRGRPPEDDDDEEAWLKWAGRKVALYPFSTLVIGRDLGNMIERKLETGRTDFTASPAFQAFGYLANSIVPLASKPFTDEELTRADIRNTAIAAGYVFKLPTRQIWLTSEYLHDWLTGEETPATPVEGLWRSLVTGKPRDK